MDHLDHGTLRYLPKRTSVVTSRGNADLLGRFGQVEELAWGEAVAVSGIDVRAIPARHWGRA